MLSHIYTPKPRRCPNDRGFYTNKDKTYFSNKYLYTRSSYLRYFLEFKEQCPEALKYLVYTKWEVVDLTSTSRNLYIANIPLNFNWELKIAFMRMLGYYREMSEIERGVKSVAPELRRLKSGFVAPTIKRCLNESFPVSDEDDIVDQSFYDDHSVLYEEDAPIDADFNKPGFLKRQETQTLSELGYVLPSSSSLESDNKAKGSCDETLKKWVDELEGKQGEGDPIEDCKKEENSKGETSLPLKESKAMGENTLSKDGKSVLADPSLKTKVICDGYKRPGVKVRPVDLVSNVYLSAKGPNHLEDSPTLEGETLNCKISPFERRGNTERTERSASSTVKGQGLISRYLRALEAGNHDEIINILGLMRPEQVVMLDMLTKVRRNSFYVEKEKSNVKKFYESKSKKFIQDIDYVLQEFFSFYLKELEDLPLKMFNISKFSERKRLDLYQKAVMNFCLKIKERYDKTREYINNTEY